MKHRLFVLFACSVTLLAPRAVFGASASPASSASAAGDSAWNTLDSLLPSSAHHFAKTQSIDWDSIVAQARAFTNKFPDHPNAVLARKIELVGLIHLDDAKPAVAATTMGEVRAYLADLSMPVRDRLEVTIVAAQAALSRTAFRSRAEQLAAHEAHARDLIQKFPSEPEGYGYLLAQAKAEESPNTRAILRELAASDAAIAIKTDAARVQAWLDLEGKSLQVTGAEAAIAASRGHVLVVYAWTNDDVGYLPVIKHMAQHPDLRFVGINLDTSPPEPALISTLPGLQLRDPAGLNGPLAQQLRLLMTPSVYLVDGQGIVQEVNAFIDAEPKALALAAKGGNL